MTESIQRNNVAKHDDIVDLFVSKSLENKTPTSFLLQDSEEVSDSLIATFPNVKASFQAKNKLKRSLVYAVRFMKRRDISLSDQSFLLTWS